MISALWNGSQTKEASVLDADFGLFFFLIDKPQVDYLSGHLDRGSCAVVFLFGHSHIIYKNYIFPSEAGPAGLLGKEKQRSNYILLDAAGGCSGGEIHLVPIDIL